MKYLLSIHLTVLNLMLVVCIVGLLTLGCAEQLTPQPTFYSPDEKHIMFIPKGTRIGDIVAPEDGIFIGKSRIIDLQIIEVPQKEQDVPRKQKRLRT